jgi:hypothetical protein
MPWMKDPEGNLHNVNWITAEVRKNALGWEVVNESEVQAQKRKTSTYSASPTSSTPESEAIQMAQNSALYSSIIFDNSPTRSHSSCDDSSNHHSHHTDSSSSHSSHDYSSHSSHDSGSSYDCSSGSDFSGGDF